ncbi:MAG: hypothetical protein ACR2PV_09180 [Gammaproteobacteria bacterium]
MDEKITTPALDESEQNKTAVKNIKDLHYDLLLSELTEQTYLNINKEKLKRLRQKRFFSPVVAIFAMTTPLILLGLLAWQIYIPNSTFMGMMPIPQALLISGCVLSFIVIYTILIKGMFSHAKEDEASPIKEVTNILREHHPGGE